MIMSVTKSRVHLGLALATSLGWMGVQENGDGRDPVRDFEAAWRTLDRVYAQFTTKHVDWDALHTLYRPRVTPETTDQELFDALAEMILPLNDMHVTLSDGTRTAYGSTLERLTPSGFSLGLVSSEYLEGSAEKAAEGAFTY